MNKIYVVSWNPEFRVIDFIRLVKEFDQNGLAAAKKKVDAFIENKEVSIELAVTSEKLEETVERLNKIGVEIFVANN